MKVSNAHSASARISQMTNRFTEIHTRNVQYVKSKMSASICTHSLVLLWYGFFVCQKKKTSVGCFSYCGKRIKGAAAAAAKVFDLYSEINLRFRWFRAKLKIQHLPQIHPYHFGDALFHTKNTRQNWKSNHFLVLRFNGISVPFFSIVIVDLICLILILILFISYSRSQMIKIALTSFVLLSSIFSLAYMIKGEPWSFFSYFPLKCQLNNKDSKESQFAE